MLQRVALHNQNKASFSTVTLAGVCWTTMPPKPRVTRKASIASKDTPSVSVKVEKDATKSDKEAMPPPPDPLPPAGILEPEMNALTDCLKVRSKVITK